MRTRSERRFNSKNKIKRKIAILESKGYLSNERKKKKPYHWYINRITFTSPYRKTKNKGKQRQKRKNYALSYNFSPRDRRIRDSLEAEL